nr:arylsulfatase [Actinomycetota bacterium]NIS29095.1 arylsulfatase [Actinomycetota bacterium]NIT94336.1 arylsulfatase [Actinomycetota bacterium]NIU17942.1 arylsulfatase [Actinomycetota bacterium]NIU64501.1 arylsulfatase [Actinomycetota bacterium]
PLIVHWPEGLGATGGIRTQYQHVTDLLPTLAELTGVEIPTAKHGAPLPAPAGASFVPALHDATAPSTHPEQYYEMIGHRGFYRDGWSAVTCRQPRTPFSEETWELHHLSEDPTEARDLAAERPDKVAELTGAWEEAALANQVLPLDEGNFVKMIQRPPYEAEHVAVTRLRPGMATLERWRALQLIVFRSFEVRIELAYAIGDQGMLFAHGDQGGGYAMYVEDGRLRFVHNGYGTMTEVDCGELGAGTDEIVLDMENEGSLRWNARIRVGGEQVAEALGLAVLMAMAPFEGIDVGIDRRSPVSWDVYERHGPFPYTGELTAVTYVPGPLAPDAGERFLDYLKEAGTRYE